MNPGSSHGLDDDVAKLDFKSIGQGLAASHERQQGQCGFSREGIRIGQIKNLSKLG